MRQSTLYKGYQVTQNMLNRVWYADPVNAITTESRLTAAHAAGLRVLIDEAAADQRPNPWELPRCGRQEVLQAA
jgi:hypothetical protein